MVFIIGDGCTCLSTSRGRKGYLETVKALTRVDSLHADRRYLVGIIIGGTYSSPLASVDNAELHQITSTGRAAGQRDPGGDHHRDHHCPDCRLVHHLTGQHRTRDDDLIPFFRMNMAPPCSLLHPFPGKGITQRFPARHISRLSPAYTPNSPALFLSRHSGCGRHPVSRFLEAVCLDSTLIPEPADIILRVWFPGKQTLRARARAYPGCHTCPETSGSRMRSGNTSSRSLMVPGSGARVCVQASGS